MNRAEGPIGYFVHHQGRGHAERAAAFAHALPPARRISFFCARDDIFPPLPAHAEVITIPSLFERDDQPDHAMDSASTPETLHCAPLGWPSITSAIATITQWFAQHHPALFITDVSAELAQLARIASVPHLCVLQHGDRSDAGHMAAYAGAVGLLAPYADALEQSDRPAWMIAKTIYAGGIGMDTARLGDRDDARARLGLDAAIELVVVLGGGGGHGLPSVPLTLGARAEPGTQWVTLGKVQSEWHETPPSNLRHLGWVDNPEDWISAADRIVSSAGNTTVHMVAAAAKPWVVVPEWRYFSEQLRKAEALERAGAAAVSASWPARAEDWRTLWTKATAIDPDAQRGLSQSDAARDAAAAVEALMTRIWQPVADTHHANKGRAA